MPSRKAAVATLEKIALDERKVADKSNLGARIRELRRSRSWNLAHLSERSRIAISTLSKVENGMLTLNYDRLQLVAQAFDMSLSEFLSAITANESRPPATARISWARLGSGAEVTTGNYEYHYLCENLRQKTMVPILSRCKARTLEEFGDLLRHEGEEFVYVIRGAVIAYTEFYGPETLGPGEGVYIDSRMGHAYLQAGDEEAWIISVNGGSSNGGH